MPEQRDQGNGDDVRRAAPYAANVGHQGYRWERIIAELAPPDAVRLACFLLRAAASDSWITDTISDEATAFYTRHADAGDEQAQRILDGIGATS